MLVAVRRHHKLSAAEMLSEEGIEASVLHMHTIKPLDTEALGRCAKGVQVIVTLEEHITSGGLGSAVTEALVGDGSERPPRIKRIGIPDAFAKHYGSQDDLMEAYGLQPTQIVDAVRRTISSLIGT